jgi:FemAB-related protein (PEP-CTERM system-associated)
MRAARPGVFRYPFLQASWPAAIANGADEPIQVGVWQDPDAWDEFVRKAPDGTIAHRWAWLGIVSATYGHQAIPLAAARGGSLAGILPLVLMRSRLFGRHLVSMPFLDMGGLCTSDPAAEAALASAAADLAASGGSQLELRHTTDRPIGLVPSRHKVTMLVDLTDGEDMLWKRLDGNRRTEVRKARKAGLIASVHGSEALPDFYSILSANLRDLGSPVHRREFFRQVMAAFGEDARIVLVRDGSRAVGAALILFHGSWVGMPWMAALRPSFPRAPGQLLYWHALCYGIARGCQVFDLGRSSPHSGTYGWKREWAAVPAQLFWHRLPSASSDDEVQRWQWGTRVWRHLPVPIATTVGAAIRGGLPQ